MARIEPFLMFQQGGASAAIELYQRAFPHSRVVSLERFGDEGPGPVGTVSQAVVELAGLRVRLFDSPVPHAFDFTPSVSLFVTCESDAELDAAHAVLADGGQVLMPLGAYPFSRRYVWLNDRFGVSWQLSV